MDRGNHRAIERGIKLAPFARRHDRPRRQSQRLKHLTDADWIDRKHLAEQCNGWLVGQSRRCGDRTLLRLLARIIEHCAGQHVFGFSMGWNAEARHVYADDADTVDRVGQQPQRHAARGRHAQVGDDDGVIFFRVGHLLDGFLDVLE